MHITAMLALFGSAWMSTIHIASKHLNNKNMTTTATKNLAQGVKAIMMTAEQVKADSAREYNQQVWEQNVNRYSKYDDVQFYKVCRDEVYAYDRFFVVYTLPEGLRLLGDFGYSSSLTNGGFFMAFISTMDVLVDDNGDIVEYKMLEPNNVYIKTSKVRVSDGEYATLATNPAARKFMTQRSKSFNQIWTKEYLTA